MKKIIKYISLLCCLFAVTSIDAQNFYKRKIEASGINTDAVQTELEAAAQSLVEAFPQDLQDKFRVFDFGFYLHQENTKGGYPEPLASMKHDISAESPFYLLFGKQSDQTGFHTKIWIELKLPNTGLFTCMNDAKRSLFKLKLEKLVTDYYKTNPGNFSAAEQFGMSKMTEMVKSQIVCCQNGNSTPACKFTCPTPDEMKDILTEKGFVPFNIKVKSKSDNGPTDPSVTNEAIKLDLEAESITTVAAEIVANLVKRKPSHAYITDDESYCKNEGFEKIMTEYENNLDDYDFIFHISKPNFIGEGIVWIKIETKLWDDDEVEFFINGDRGAKDPNVEKLRLKIVNSNTFTIPGRLLTTSNVYLGEVGNAGYIPNPNCPAILFERSTHLFGLYYNHNQDYGKYFKLEDNTTYKIWVAKEDDERSCYQIGNVDWTPTSDTYTSYETLKTIAKNNQKWSKVCEEKQIVNREKLKSFLANYQTSSGKDAAIFEIVSTKGTTSYVTSKGTLENKPTNYDQSTVFKISEHSDGSISVKAQFKVFGINEGLLVAETAKAVVDKSLAGIAVRHGGKLRPNKNAIDKDLYEKANGALGADSGTTSDGGFFILGNLGVDQGGAMGGVSYSPMTIGEMLAAVAKGYNDLVENTKIPVEIWEPGKKFPVRDFTGVISGVGDQVIDDSKDIVGLVGMGLTLISDPPSAYESLKGFGAAFAGNPWDMTKKIVGGIANEGLQLENFSKGGQYARYATGRVGANIITAVAVGIYAKGFKGALKEIPATLRKKGDDLANAIKAMIARLKNIGVKNPDKYADNVTQAVEKLKKNGCDDACAFGKIGCLTGNTLVEIGQGKFLPMSSIQSGTMVNSFNYITKKKEQKAIITVEKFITTSILAFTLSSGSIIEATPNHPFYINSAYLEAKNLHIGDTLFSGNSKFITIIGIFAKDTIQEVYNLRVADNDNYFAGEDALLNTNCLVKRFEDAKFANLSKKFDALTDAEKIKFLEDFGGADDALLDVLQDNPKLLDSWKKGNLLEVDLLTVNKKVKKPGGRITEFKNFEHNNSNIHPKYLENQARFDEFSYDPAQGVTKGTGRKEAMSILEFEEQGFIQNAKRSLDPKAECYNGVTGEMWDVKTPSSHATQFPNASIETQTSSIKTQLEAADWTNPITGASQPPKVIFDCTYLTEADYLLAKNYLQSNLTASQLERVTEINIKIK